jgi:hypothetical protein
MSLWTLPVLHDDDEVLAGRGEQADVLQRIAGHDQQVGVSAG